MRKILFISLACLAATPVHAECIDDIRAVFRLKGDIKDMRVYMETFFGETVVQKANGWIKDYANAMHEVVGGNWWSMQRDGTRYNSTDGKNWNKTGEFDPEWEAKARAQAEVLLADMRDPVCLGTEQIDGNAYEVYRYRFVTTNPVPSDVVTTIYYDRDSNYVFRSIAEFKENGGGKMIQTYTPDDSFVLPDIPG